jgi:DNA-binding CsgD family transcriptional regulator
MVGSDKSDTVRFDELQQVLGLALELRELPHGSELQRRHALTGLTKLLGAQVGLWLHIDGMTRGTAIIRRATDLGWATESERRTFLGFVDSAQETALDPSVGPLSRAISSPISTFVREQLLPDRPWYHSDHVQHYRRAAHLDSCLYGMYVPGGDAGVCLSLHRPWGDRTFCERERRLFDTFHRACTFLHEPPTDIAPALLRGLSPRLRDTLRGLAKGKSEKQLAHDLGLSPHTVHGYIKSLHRQFGVQSRGELLALCLARH